jgi:hypothetical protein
VMSDRGGARPLFSSFLPCSGTGFLGTEGRDVRDVAEPLGEGVD